jgi:hypothetical protein
MNFSHLNAGGTPAWKTIALILLCLCGSLAWAGHADERSLDGDVVVTVVPDATWKAAYPSCTVHASAAECGVLPEVTVTGTNCFPTTGTMNLATVTVEDAPAACIARYRVQAVNGQVIIIVIDGE